MSGIHLDPKHGLNPCTTKCFYCGGDKDITMFGRLHSSTKRAFQEAGLDVSDGKAPNGVILDKEPCDKCLEHMGQGVILISCRAPTSEKEQQNPYRTGGWVVVKDELIQKAVHPEELCNSILKKRVAFMPDEVWDALGLPRKENDDAGETEPGRTDL